MEYAYTKGRIEIKKELLKLDEFVLSFVKILDTAKIKYVIVSGYVGIFFGRSRNTEDIDILIERCSKEKFIEFWTLAGTEFECMNSTDRENAYKDYLEQNSALRFHLKGSFIPNMELKFIKNEIDRFTLENRIEIVLNRMRTLFFSPLEMQVAYKLYLGSEKDLEDARFIYKLFSVNIDHTLLKEMLSVLKVPKPIINYLGGKDEKAV
jgi:hypothetical protein